METSSTPAIIKKAVASLSMVPTAGKITVLGRKTWNVLLSIAQDQERMRSASDIFKAPLSQIAGGINFNSKNLEVIKDHFRSMVGTTVEWQSPTQGEGARWDVCGMLAHAALYVERGQTWAEWSYASNMRAELLDPDVFAKLSLDIISQLRTLAAVALYESCSRYRAVGQTARKPWRWWAPVLLGRPDDDRIQKLEYRIFKRDTLRPALAEINAVTELDVKVVETRQGRFVNDLQFIISGKPKHSGRRLEASAAVDFELVARAVALGIDHVRFERLLEEEGIDAVRAAMPAVEKRAITPFPEPLRDAYRYLKTLLASHVEPPSGQGAKKAEESDFIQQAPSLMPKPKTTREANTRKWVASRLRSIGVEFGALPSERQTELEKEFLAELVAMDRHPAIIQRLRTSGWRHPLVHQKIIEFYAERVYGHNWDQPTPDQLLQVEGEGAAA